MNKIPITNLTPESAIKREIKVRYPDREEGNRWKIFAVGIVIGLLSLSFFLGADATEHLSDGFCNSNMCKARVERLNECMNSSDVFHCATTKTLDESYIYIYEDIQSLYVIAKEAGAEPHWKKKTIELIRNHEGLALVSYCDRLVAYTKPSGSKGLMRSCPTGRERYSIGYGTKSYKGENIGAEQAEDRMFAELENNFFPYVEQTKCNYSGNEKAAIADFMYNSGVYRAHATTGTSFLSYVQECNRGVIKDFMNPKYYLGGMKKRKQAELNLFTK